MYDSRSAVDRALDALIGYEIQKLNNHLPRQRRTLSELLATNNDPTIEASEGTILLRRSELQELAKIVPTEYHDRLRIPFVILRRMEMGRSIYTVAGDRIETFTIQKILGRTDDSFHEMYKHREQTFLYRPEVTELVGKFHTLVVIGFGVPQELTDYAPKRD
ncbi:MAG: DUF61 family protein [Candidatus Bathyarchaeia archaeon]|jgi:hypothetical protein